MQVQGYLTIDYQERNAQENEQFFLTLQPYMINYHLIKKGQREYYHCILRSEELINELLTLLIDRSPIINGVWKQNGIPFGISEKVIPAVYDADDNLISEEIIEYYGSPIYPFDLDLHISNSPPELRLVPGSDDSFQEVPVTEFKPLHKFAGWEVCQLY